MGAVKLREGEQCDSALVRGNFVFLTSCYKGYSISIAISYYTKKAGEELELMLEHSKFSK
jgi:hypothetical protein